mgnify:CR=1 FL=1|jgi:hypothetical protein|uniref:Uncharacterized protein n=1 Tax=viral metagenome TaxID=1070528 RepID=A0A6C0ISP6_9ZZZZ
MNYLNDPPDIYPDDRNEPDNNYGYFVSLNETNEIMRYSRNGTAIYYKVDPPATPVKKAQSSREDTSSESHIVINLQPKFSENTVKIHSRQHMFDVIYAILTIIFGVITMMCIYFIMII